MKLKQHLNNLTILVTRPHPAGAELCDLIELHGGHAIHLPTITFESLINEKNFIDSIRLIGQQNCLIFISPQAVYASISVLRREWPDLPPYVKLAAIGGGTAKALLHAGYQATIQPKENWGSEEFLALPEFQSLIKQKIAIIRGEDGRELLEQTLTARGAHVLSILAYRRVLPKINIKSSQMLLKQNTIDTMIITSGEGIRNLMKMIEQTLHPFLLTIPLIVVSERIKKLAHDLGFQTIWVARNASHHAILEFLAEKRKELCLMKTNP